MSVAAVASAVDHQHLVRSYHRPTLPPQVFALSVIFADINAQALHLSLEEKRELIQNLVVSLDCDADADPAEVARAWGVEIARRVEAMDKGEGEWIDGDEVFAQVDAMLRAGRD